MRSLFALGIYMLTSLSLRWIFIVEGVITIGFGLLALLFLTSSPTSASWLSERERQIVILENEADRALLAEEPFDKAQILSAFTDWRVYLWALVYISVRPALLSSV